MTLFLDSVAKFAFFRKKNKKKRLVHRSPAVQRKKENMNRNKNTLDKSLSTYN